MQWIWDSKVLVIPRLRSVSVPIRSLEPTNFDTDILEYLTEEFFRKADKLELWVEKLTVL